MSKQIQFETLIEKYQVPDNLVAELEYKLRLYRGISKDMFGQHIYEDVFLRWYALVLANAATELSQESHRLAMLSDKMYDKYFEIK